jgi:hypothetical protein
MFSLNKMQMFIALLLFLFCGGLFYSLLKINQAKACQLIPREVLFGYQAKKVQLSVSPQGDKLAYIAPVGTVCK